MKTLLAAALLITAMPAMAATNLVVNGDFGTGDFTGWTQFGDDSFTFVSNGVAFFGPVDFVGGISQSITAGPGHYILSFDLANDGGAPTIAEVKWGAATLLSQSDNAGFGSTTFSFNVSGGTKALSFGFLQVPAYYSLDNVSLTAVPEAATWAMMIAGFGLTGAAMRRRRAAIAA